MIKKLYRAAAAAMAMALVLSVPVKAAAVNFGTAATVNSDSIPNWPKGPDTVSETAVLIDANTGAVLYDKGMDELRYPASTTKMMTVLVAMENSQPRDPVTFTETGIRDITWDSANINMKLGETIAMRDCWYAAIIASANEVCAQMAEHVGGTEAQFVEMMNQKAQELGCTNTHFTNASGLPDPNHYTTAHDLAKILQAGLENKRFRKVLQTTSHTIPATNLSEARNLHTHMPLIAKESNLYYEGCIGGKTGNTNDAGHTLAVAAERNGRTYIAVTLRAADLGGNCTDSRALFDYAFTSFDTIDINGTAITVPKGVTVSDLSVQETEKDGRIYNQYSYGGQYVGTAAAPEPTPVPETVPNSPEDSAIDPGSAEGQAQIIEEEEDGLSSMSRILLGVMAGMAVILAALMIALHFKEKKMYRSRR